MRPFYRLLGKLCLNLHSLPLESAADAPDRAKHSFKMFPIAFQENITRLLGPEGGARLLAALNDEVAPVGVRFNPLKGGAAAKA